MTDGGKLARRSGRLYTEDHSAHENMSSDGHIPATRERTEKQTDRESQSWDSSCSEFSVLDSGTELQPRSGSRQSSNDDLDQIKYLNEEIDGQPVNFGAIIPGVYRSGFPRRGDYQFLESLGLKTILYGTLVHKDYPEGYQAFILKNGIRHIIIDMKGTKKVAISQSIMDAAAEVILDQQNYPLLVHCNHGKHRTGCVVAVIRKFLGWHIDSIIEEYTEYAEPKTREEDIQYIQGFDVESLNKYRPKSRQNSILKAEDVRIMSQTKMAKMIFVAMFMLSLSAFVAIQIRG